MANSKLYKKIESIVVYRHSCSRIGEIGIIFVISNNTASFADRVDDVACVVFVVS